MVERDRLEERLGSEAGPAAEQVMQLVGRDAGGMGDRLDLGLGAPMLGDIGDGAADDAVVVGGRRREGTCSDDGLRSWG